MSGGGRACLPRGAGAAAATEARRRAADVVNFMLIMVQILYRFVVCSLVCL